MKSVNHFDQPPPDDMVEGYMDGLNPNNPKPSSNRSYSYCHGFAVARSDVAMQPAFGGADKAREMARIAMEQDHGF